MPEFQPLTTRDVEPLVAMMHAMFTNDGSLFNEAAARQGLAHALSPAGANAARVWLIKDGGEIAGYIALTFSFSFEFGGWCGFIDELYLREPFRGRGWGTVAIEMAASECTALGMRALLIEAELTNERATSLYRRRGFVEHSRRLMRRMLSP